MEDYDAAIKEARDDLEYAAVGLAFTRKFLTNPNLLSIVREKALQKAKKEEAEVAFCRYILQYTKDQKAYAMTPLSFKKSAEGKKAWAAIQKQIAYITKGLDHVDEKPIEVVKLTVYLADEHYEVTAQTSSNLDERYAESFPDLLNETFIDVIKAYIVDVDAEVSLAEAKANVSNYVTQSPEEILDGAQLIFLDPVEEPVFDVISLFNVKAIDEPPSVLMIVSTSTPVSEAPPKLVKVQSAAFVDELETTIAKALLRLALPAAASSPSPVTKLEYFKFSGSMPNRFKYIDLIDHAT